MKRWFCRLFTIYPGEESAALLLTLLGFLWALAISAALKFSDALFLLNVGADQLPVIYGISASTMIVLASFLLYAFHRFETHHIFLSTIGAGLVIYSVLLFCVIKGLGIESGTLWYALRITSTLLMTVSTTCYWTFIDQYYSLQDAKRLFSLFSSAIFLGIATTGLIMQMGIFELEQVLMLVLVILVIAGLCIRHIHKQLLPIHDENSLQESASQGELSTFQIIQMVIRSPFTILLMISNFVIYIGMVVTEYSYLESFQHHFPPLSPTGEGEQAALTLFLGRCLLSVSIANVCIGLFIYSRLVRRFGVSGVLPITAIILVLNYSGWLISDALFFAVVGLFVVEGTLYVVDDSNFNLLLNAVPPRLKYRVRIVIESFCEPTGMLLSSGLLALFPFDSHLLGLFLAILMLLLAGLLGYNYGRAIYLNLAENAIHFHRSLQDWLMPEAPSERRLLQEQLLHHLENGSGELKLTAAEGLLAYGEPSLVKAVVTAATSWTDAEKLALLPFLTPSLLNGDRAILEAIENWAGEEEVEESLLAGQIQLVLAYEEGQKLLISNLEGEVVMGLNLVGLVGGAQDVDLLVPYLRDRRPAVARAAMKAFARVADSHHFRHLRLLVRQLMRIPDSAYRLACIETLIEVGGTSAVTDLITASVALRPNERRAAESAIASLGLRTVPLLLALTKNRTLPERSRILAVRVLSRLALPQLRGNLRKILEWDISRAYFYFYHSQTLKGPPTIDLYTLQETLLTRYQQMISFIIHVLGEAGQIEDCELLVRSLLSPHPKTRSQAVEALLKSCHRDIFQKLYPLVADIPISEKLVACQRYYGSPLPLEQLLSVMDSSASPLERMVAAMYKKQLNIPSWRVTLQQQMHKGDETFLHLAYELLEGVS